MQRDKKPKPNVLDLARLWIKERYAKPGRVFVGMVHRLDAPVAGVLVLARTSKAAARLSAQFREGAVEKIYRAVVQRRPPENSGRLVHELVRRGRYSRIADAAGAASQKAALSYHLIASNTELSLLEIRLETGRRHQIRAQLAAMGCPIHGDRSYGAPHPLAHGRIALIAHKLKFFHPTRNTEMVFETPLPEGWPWPGPIKRDNRPLWTIEEYLQNGLALSMPGFEMSNLSDHPDTP